MSQKLCQRALLRKKSVVCALTKSFGIMNTDKKVINLGLSTCDKEAIQNFYQQNKMSSPSPSNMAKVHSLFVGENPTIVVGKSKFAAL